MKKMKKQPKNFRFILAFLVPVIVCGASLPAFSQELIGGYMAFLGPRDHFNSRGDRLTRAWQIIRQDRANYHRFGIRDAGDQGDSFFASKRNRAIVERMIRRGRISRAARRAIVNGNVYINVKIYGYGRTGRHIDISVE